jgi:hypothetical protein
VIRALAVSLSGSEHIVVGGVRDGASYKWQTEEEARAHLERIQWTNIRFQVDEKETSNGTLIITWDNQAKTEHVKGKGEFTYLRGGPAVGKKLSKSDLNK